MSTCLYEGGRKLIILGGGGP
jgi:Galactose oxidase, central domain